MLRCFTGILLLLYACLLLAGGMRDPTETSQGALQDDIHANVVACRLNAAQPFLYSRR